MKVATIGGGSTYSPELVQGFIERAERLGLRELWLMVEAARSAVRYDPHWRKVHQRIARRRGTNIATVAVARKLMVVIWHLLTDKTIYRHLRPQTFVTKLQNWAFRIGRDHLPAPSSKEFVYDHLIRLGLKHLAQALTYKGKHSRLSLQAA